MLVSQSPLLRRSFLSRSVGHCPQRITQVLGHFGEPALEFALEVRIDQFPEFSLQSLDLLFQRLVGCLSGLLLGVEANFKEPLCRWYPVVGIESRLENRTQAVILALG